MRALRSTSQGTNRCFFSRCPCRPGLKGSQGSSRCSGHDKPVEPWREERLSPAGESPSHCPLRGAFSQGKARPWWRAYWRMNRRVRGCSASVRLWEPHAQRKRVWTGRLSCSYETRNRVSYPWPGWSARNGAWRPALSRVANRLEELWVGVKCQTNAEIAGSPRNALRCSAAERIAAGRALLGLGGRPLTKPRQTAKCRDQSRSKTVGDKLHRQKGNSPDHQVRSLSRGSVSKDVRTPKQPGGWLRSSHPWKSA